MKRTIVSAIMMLAAAAVCVAQDVGDHETAGYSSSRTYLNSNQGDFKPPLRLSATVDLAGVTDASSLLAFTNGDGMRLLVGDAGAPSFRLFDADTGNQRWAFPLPGFSGPLNYIPSYSGDVVLLGGAATTGVAAVRVSNGATLWTDPSVGMTAGRYPVLSNGLALYAGRSAVVAADPVTGPAMTFWRRATTTAEAPLSVFGDRAYFLEQSGTLRAVNVRNGVEVWSLAGVGAVNPNLIATNGLLFINTAANQFGALDTANGGVVWAGTSSGLSDSPATALAYERLFVFGANGSLSALDPNTGVLIWRADEDGPGLDYGLVANNVVYYYHQAGARLRARDAFTGNLLWSRQIDDVRGLSAAGGNLFVLLPDSVQVYEAANRIYFAQIADGGGQRTLFTLNNPNPVAITGVAEFFDDNGDPLPLTFNLVAPPTASRAFEIPPGSTLGFMSLGLSSPAAPGWARVTADGPLSGSAIFEFVDDEDAIVTEAGVADSTATGFGNVFIQLALPPVRPLALSTGVAVANISDEDTVVTYRLLDGDGVSLGSISLPLAAGAHTARFVEQLFPGETGNEFVGSLVIESDLPIAVTALRTQSGVQLSSYVVGQ